MPMVRTQSQRLFARAGFRLSFSYIHSRSPIGARFRLPRLHVDRGGTHDAFRLSLAFPPPSVPPRMPSDQPRP